MVFLVERRFHLTQGYQWCSTSRLGPEDLMMGTLTDAPCEEIPTVVQNLHKQGKISEEVFGVFFAPTTTDSSINGEITFGCTNSIKYMGTIAYTLAVSLTWQQWPSCLPSFRVSLPTIRSRPAVDPSVTGRSMGREEAHRRAYDRQRQLMRTTSALQQMSTTYLCIHQTHLHHLTDQRIHQMNPRASSSRGRGDHG